MVCMNKIVIGEVSGNVKNVTGLANEYGDLCDRKIQAYKTQTIN